MVSRRLVVPDIVRRKAAKDGDDGAAWTTGLPDVLDELARSWSLQIGAQIPGGTASLTVRVRTANGTPAVLKLAVPDPAFAGQRRTLIAARGRGYVRLLAHDERRHAVLLESLGPSVDRCGLAPENQLAALADTLREAWTIPRPVGPGAIAIDKARVLATLVTDLWHRHGRPWTERVLARALECAERRSAAFDPQHCVVVHGDAAPPNLLRAPPRPGAESGFVFVDPDGFVGDAAYDLGVAVRDWSAELVHGDPSRVIARYCELLSARSGIDAGAIWEWGFLERVSTGLYASSLHADHLARPLMESAEALVDPG